MLITIPFANCLLVMLNFTRSVNMPMLVLGEKRKLMSYFIKIQLLIADNTRSVQMDILFSLFCKFSSFISVF